MYNMQIVRIHVHVQLIIIISFVNITIACIFYLTPRLSLPR